jgi:O-methyltransferase
MSIAGSDLDPPHVAARRLRQIIESRFADGLQRARTPCADGPGATAESLRAAYLGLLKLALCDLVGTTTTSVERAVGGEVMSRELADDDLRFRAAGLDWPLHGLSMVGLARLDDLQQCVENVVADGVAGDLIECGSWRGGAAMLMRATLDTLGETGRNVFVADSFQGFPEVDAGQEYSLDADLANVGFLSVPLAEVRASFARLGVSEGVTFVAGFFAATLPALRGHRWAVARLDGDSYDATRSALDAVYPSLSVGGYLVIDDFYPLEDCRRAVEDFRAEYGIAEPIEAVDWNAARWRRVTEAGPAPEPESETALPEPVGPAVSERIRVPTTDEVAMRHELSIVQERLAAAEREIGRLTGAPLAGPRAWLRRRGRGIGAPS